MISNSISKYGLKEYNLKDYKDVPSCSTCANSMMVVSENGFHRECSLSRKTSVKCITGCRENYVRIKGAYAIDEGHI